MQQRTCMRIQRPAEMTRVRFVFQQLVFFFCCVLYLVTSRLAKCSGKILNPEMTAPRSMKSDHISYDTLDNRRENLRWLDGTARHARARRLFAQQQDTGYRGVYFCNQSVYPAVLGSRGKRYCSARYDSAIEAARASIASRYSTTVNTRSSIRSLNPSR